MIFRRFSAHISHENHNCFVKDFDLKFKTRQNHFFFLRDTFGFICWYYDYFGGVLTIELDTLPIQ